MATKQECEENVKDFDDMTPEEQAAEIAAMNASNAAAKVAREKRQAEESLPAWILNLAK